MEPVTTALLTAFVIGASKGATGVGEKAVNDAYAALKHLIVTAYGGASALVKAVAGLEEKPESQGRKAVLAEELQAAKANDDEKLLDAAENVIAAAESSGTSRTIGVDWEDVKMARLKIGEIKARAGAIGFRAARMEITGDVEIHSIDSGDDSSGKK